MNSSIRRDNWLTIIGTTLTVGFFVLVIYLPGEHACQAARRDIAAANRTIDGMPLLILQADVQQKKVAAREKALNAVDRLLDDEHALHGVLQKVADLAKANGLRVERIQPQGTIQRESYKVVPFQLTVSGNFRRIASLLLGLETQPTLFAVERFSLKGESGQTSESLKADITFSVFVKREAFAGFAENVRQPEPNSSR